MERGLARIAIIRSHLEGMNCDADEFGALRAIAKGRLRDGGSLRIAVAPLIRAHRRLKQFVSLFQTLIHLG